MPSVSLRAHFDGTAIRLDEPYELPKDAKLIVTVLASPLDAEREAWFQFSSQGLNRAYGENEPEYTDADLQP